MYYKFFDLSLFLAQRQRALRRAEYEIISTTRTRRKDSHIFLKATHCAVLAFLFTLCRNTLRQSIAHFIQSASVSVCSYFF